VFFSPQANNYSGLQNPLPISIIQDFSSFHLGKGIWSREP
jgi:hypothetical protein